MVLGALLLLRPRGAPAMAAWDLSCAAKPRRRRWSEDEEDPAVLVLSHFSRPPHLSFGSLRVGASRTRLLGIHNPNAEDVEVVVERVPPPARGFSIGCRRFSLQVPGVRRGEAASGSPSPEGKAEGLVLKRGGRRAKIRNKCLRFGRKSWARLMEPVLTCGGQL